MFTAISNAHSTLFEFESMIEMIISEYSDVSRWLDKWRVVSFFKPKKFKIGEAIKFLNARIQQLSEEK